MDRREAQAQLGCGDVDRADPYPHQEIFRDFRTRHADPRLALERERSGPRFRQVFVRLFRQL